MNLAILALAVALPLIPAKGELPEGGEQAQEPAFESSLSCSVYYSESEGSEKKLDEQHIYGDVYFTIEEGNAGDEVTAIVKGNPTFSLDGTKLSILKYNVSSVTLNGEAINHLEGEPEKYVFTLALGENKFEVLFCGVTPIGSATDLSTLNWSALLSVDGLLTIIGWAITILLSSGFFITLIRSKKIKSKTIDQVSAEFEKVAGTTLEGAITNFLQEDVKPLIGNQDERLSALAESNETFLRCFLLSQENTPEARLAIAKELEKLKMEDADLSKRIQEIVEGQIQEHEQKKQALAQSLAEVEESTSRIESEQEQQEEEYDGTSI